MKTYKLWWSMLVALMLPLSFTLTACSDDDDDKDGGSGSNVLSETVWITDYNGAEEEIYFWDEGEFEVEVSHWADYAQDTEFYTGQYSVKSDQITIKDLSRNGFALSNGSFKFKISGNKGHRTLVIYNAQRGGGDIEYEETEYDDSYDEPEDE